jgi:hypothetical protein
MTKLIVAFRNFESAPKNQRILKNSCAQIIGECNCTAVPLRINVGIHLQDRVTQECQLRTTHVDVITAMS